jgi:hypothetical protein
MKANINTLTETELDKTCGGQMNMTATQSIVSQMSILTQLSSNIVRSINDGSTTVTGNIK